MHLQLWAMGRGSSIEQLKRENLPFECISAGDVALLRTPQQEENSVDAPRPRPLTKAEIAEYVRLYATATRNTVEHAGFDGVEIHGANGYLPDQFLREARTSMEAPQKTVRASCSK